MRDDDFIVGSSSDHARIMLGISKIGRVRSPKRRVRDDDFMVGSSSDHPRIMVGLSSNRLYIGGSNSESFRCNLELEDFVAGAVFAEVGG